MTDLFNKIDSGANFDKDRKYRYALWRIWDKDKPIVMYIGLNPSTANAYQNDNTITKLIKITNFNGFGGFYMMNLFAIISSDPKILKTCDDPIGDNDIWLKDISLKCDTIVFCWGNFKEAQERSKEVISMFANPFCLALNKNKTPKHPLYCLDNTKLIPFS